MFAQEPDLGTEAQREAGKEIYQEKCAQCHGENGDGEGIAKYYFRPVPRDLTSGSYKIRTTESGELPTDDDLKAIIKIGMPYTGMPGWPDFSDKEIANLVYYIKTFAEDFADSEAMMPPFEIPETPVFSQESVEKGRKVFEENKCMDCHGLYGRGDGESAPTLKDDEGQFIKTADMTMRWTYRGGASRRDIYRTFTSGLNGTPMPSYADLLRPEDRWNLVDYVYSLSRDDANYATLVIAKGKQGELDILKHKDLFLDAQAAMFPIIAQVIEPGREFFPSVNAVEVKAVYNEDEIAIMLLWHDMSTQKSGKNSPDIAVPVFDPEAEISRDKFSDAIAIQFPVKMPHRSIKPYFLFGDKKNPVEIWFADLAENKTKVFRAKGSNKINYLKDRQIEFFSNYDHGEWMVVFKQKRNQEGSLSFNKNSYVPIAFSIWDGFNNERGNKRGISSWYYLYLEPVEVKSAMIPVFSYGVLLFFMEIGIIYWIRRKFKDS